MNLLNLLIALIRIRLLNLLKLLKLPNLFLNMLPPGGGRPVPPGDLAATLGSKPEPAVEERGAHQYRAARGGHTGPQGVPARGKAIRKRELMWI